jgi:hypothetical protein
MDGTILDDHIAEYASAISSQAIRSADLVDALLNELGIAPESGRPISLPTELLRGLGLAMKFAAWESNHIFVHVEAGLPGAAELVARVLELRHGPELEMLVHRVAIDSLALVHRHFAWRVSADQGDVAIIGDEDEDFLDAVADFLWARRQAACRECQSAG